MNAYDSPDAVRDQAFRREWVERYGANTTDNPRGSWWEKRCRCGRIFYPDSKLHRYCSTRCAADARNSQRRWQRQRYKGTARCALCHGEISRTHRADAKTCSPACRQALSRRSRRQAA